MTTKRSSTALPQWIAVILLSVIGALLGVIWEGLDRRLAVIEKVQETTQVYIQTETNAVSDLKYRVSALESMILPKKK